MTDFAGRKIPVTGATGDIGIAKLRRFESFTCHHVLKGPLMICGNAAQGPLEYPGGVSKMGWASRATRPSTAGP
jgi:hypothetical protein